MPPGIVSAKSSRHWISGVARGQAGFVPQIGYQESMPTITKTVCWVAWIGGSFLPSIGGLGVLEGLFQRFFGMVGVAPASAVALCVLYRIAQLIASLPGAIPAYREWSAKGVRAITETELADPLAQAAVAK